MNSINYEKYREKKRKHIHRHKYIYMITFESRCGDD